MRAPRSGRQSRCVAAGEGLFEVEHRRCVEEHDAAFGDGEVVHHHRIGEVDLGPLHDRAGRVGPVEGQVRREQAVAEEQHLAGGRVDVRVRGHRSRQRPPKS